MTHLSINQETSLDFDDFISSHQQLRDLSVSLAHNFVSEQSKHKIVINVADHFGLNNNCGFNLTNFKPKVVREQFTQVHRDYERSVIGQFVQSTLQLIQPTDFYLFFALVKFEN